MINARQLVDLLAVRHSKDVFVSECKTGPTQCGPGVQSMDAWAVRKSWAHPLAIAYEVKVSRSDFVHDDKWRGYLEYCNQFYFVAPPKLINPNELPAEAGLLVCSANATRLYTKKKSPYRDVTLPDSLYRYILFSRASIHRPGKQQEDYAGFWRRWLRGKQDLSDMGKRVSKRLQERFREEIYFRDTKQDRLTKDIDRLTNAQKMLTALGFTADHVPLEYSIRERLDELREAVPRQTFWALSSAIKALNAAETKLKALTDTAEEPSE